MILLSLHDICSWGIMFMESPKKVTDDLLDRRQEHQLNLNMVIEL